MLFWSYDIRVIPLDFKREKNIVQGFITYSAIKTNVIQNLAIEILVICGDIRSVTTFLLGFLNMTVNYFFQKRRKRNFGPNWPNWPNGIVPYVFDSSIRKYKLFITDQSRAS